VAYTGIWKGGDTWGSKGLPPAGSKHSVKQIHTTQFLHVISKPSAAHDT